MKDYRKTFRTSASRGAKAALGQMSVQWGLLEGLIEAALWRALGVPYDVGRAITNQLQMRGKIDALCSVLNQTDPHLAEQFKPVGDFVQGSLSSTRNKYTHGFWARSPAKDSPDHVVKFNAKGSLVSIGGDVTAAEIKALSDDIMDVSNWMMAFSDLLPPLPQPPDGRGHTARNSQTRQERANQKKLALQPPTARPSTPPKSSRGTKKRP